MKCDDLPKTVFSKSKNSWRSRQNIKVKLSENPRAYTSHNYTPCTFFFSLSDFLPGAKSVEFTSYKVVNITNENTEAYLLICLGGLCIKTTTALARELNLNSIFTVNQMIEDLLLSCIVQFRSRALVCSLGYGVSLNNRTPIHMLTTPIICIRCLIYKS